jgi:hypothetical protein
MSDFEVILRLVMAALLVGYLFIRSHSRARHRFESEPAEKRTVKPVDATKLLLAIDRVRHDHLAARPPQRRSVWRRNQLVDSVGLKVGRLSFFRDGKSEADAERDQVSL